MAVLALLSTAVVLASPASADTYITSEGPLSSVGVTSDLNCYISHIADELPELFGGTACGTFIAVNGVVYGPALLPAGSSAVRTPYTAVSQQGPTGSGTAADPFMITTVVDAGDTGLRITQNDYYEVGQETTRTDVTVTNSGAARNVIVYRAGDCYLQDSDLGIGAIIGNAPTCKAPEGSADENRIQQFVPLTPGSNYIEDRYSVVWAAVGSAQPFPDTCNCTGVIHDNGAGLSWSLAVPANSSVTASSLMAFSPVGAQPIQIHKTASPPSIEAGGTVTYTVQIDNPGFVDATLDSIVDDLPAGFSYHAGSTAGDLGAEPAVNGQKLTWNGPIVVPAQGSLTFTFDTTAPDTPGNLKVKSDRFGIKSISGTATIPSFATNGTSATVKVSIQRLLNLPVHLGVVTVKDQAAVMHITAVQFIGGVSGSGSTATVKAGGLNIPPRDLFGIRTVSTQLTVRDLG